MVQQRSVNTWKSTEITQTDQTDTLETVITRQHLVSGTRSAMLTEQVTSGLPGAKLAAVTRNASTGDIYGVSWRSCAVSAGSQVVLLVNCLKNSTLGWDQLMQTLWLVFWALVLVATCSLHGCHDSQGGVSSKPWPRGQGSRQSLDPAAQ